MPVRAPDVVFVCLSAEKLKGRLADLMEQGVKEWDAKEETWKGGEVWDARD